MKIVLLIFLSFQIAFAQGFGVVSDITGLPSATNNGIDNTGVSPMGKQIQAFIASNKKVYFPAGSYSLADTQVVINEDSGFVIVCHPQAKFLIGPNTALGHTSGGGEYPGAFTFDSVVDLYTENITVDFQGNTPDTGPSPDASGNGIRIQSVEGRRSHDIVIINPRLINGQNHNYNIWIDGADNGIIINPYVEGIDADSDEGGEGIEINGNDWQVFGGLIKRIDGNAIDLFPDARNIRIYGTSVRNIFGNGVLISSASGTNEDILLNGLNIQDTGALGINIDGNGTFNRIRVVGCQLDSNNTSQIQVGNGTGTVNDIEVKGNNFTNALGHFNNTGSINFNGVTSGSIVGNFINHPSTAAAEGNGIILQNSSNILVDANSIRNTRYSGVLATRSAGTIENLTFTRNVIKEAHARGNGADSTIRSGIFVEDDINKVIFEKNQISDTGGNIDYGIVAPSMDADDIIQQNSIADATVGDILVLDINTTYTGTLISNNENVVLEQSLTDWDATPATGLIIFPTGKSGYGQVMIGDNQESSSFTLTAAGVVTLAGDATANVVNTDTDTNLCIYDAGAGIAIKNRLGATLTIKVVIYFF